MRERIGKVSCVTTLLVLSALSVTSAHGPTAPQGPTLHEHANPPAKAMVDGSKNPKLIPDRVALRALFMALQMPAKPSVQDLVRFRAKVARMNLVEADEQALIQHLKRFHELKTDQDKRVAAARETFRSTLGGLRPIADADNEVNVLADQTYNNLLRVPQAQGNNSLPSLSPLGASSLRAHLDYVKTKTKIYAPPDMSMTLHAR